MMPKGESLFHKFPDYRVELVPSPALVSVRVGDTVVAESTRTVEVRETKHDPVVYVPRDDVRFELLEATDHHTFCPFKGEASYWTARVGDREIENGIWGYDDPFPEVAGIEQYVAFYADRFEIVVA